MPSIVTVSFHFYSYGAKIRGPHALVMTFLFRSGRYPPPLHTPRLGESAVSPQCQDPCTSFLVRSSRPRCPPPPQVQL